MKKMSEPVTKARAILCVILCVAFTALTVFQFGYHGALAWYRVELAEKTNEIKNERDETVKDLLGQIADKDNQITNLLAQIDAKDARIAAITARADALAARLVSLTGSETGTAEDCLRLLIASALREQDKKVGTTVNESRIAAQVEAYMNTYAADALAVAEQLLFLDYLYRSNYIGEIDTEVAADAMARAYINAANDIYGVYYNPEEYQEYLRKLNSSVCGIGCIVGTADRDTAIEILYTHSKSSALAAGLRVGDLIRSVNGKTVAELGYTEACSRISGEAGSRVTLTVERGGATLTFTVERVESEADVVIARTYIENGVKIGYIRILNFTALTGTQFANAVRTAEQEGVEAFVFDVRENPGGLLSSILEVLEYILPKDTPLVSYDYKNQNNALSTRYDKTEQAMTKPIYVLQNQTTASAAELFAAVLGDNGATLIGTATFGKGTMQAGYKLTNGSYVTVSVARYAPGLGENYEGVGVLPDVEAMPEGIFRDASIWKLPYEEDVTLQAALSLASEK